jgi:hypothetical protein
MIIQVEQVKSSLKNKFNIKVNNELKYLAGTPWMKLSLPFDIDETRRSVITDLDNNIKLLTSFNVIDNLKRTLPNIVKFATGQVQQGNLTTLIDESNNVVGGFYKTSQGVGLTENKLVIEYNNELIIGYTKSVGKTENISLYKDNIQIGQIVKNLDVVNNLDNYYIFLLDDYSNLELVLSFFTIYFDYKNYNNSGEVFYGKKYSVQYTISKTDNYYNPLWIRNNFDLENLASFYIELDKKNQKYIKNEDRNIKLIFLGMFLFLLILTGIFAIIGIFSPEFWNVSKWFFIVFFISLLFFYIVYLKQKSNME